MPESTEQPVKRLSRAMKRGGALWNFGLYLGASGVTNAVGFLVLVPILTRHMMPAEYGNIALYKALIAFAVPVVGLNMKLNITQRFFHAAVPEIARLVTDLMAALLLMTVVVTAALVVFFGSHTTLAGLPRGWVYTVPLVACATVINDFYLTTRINQKAAAQVSAFETAAMAFGILGSVILVVGLDYGWKGRALMLCATPMVLAIASLRFLLQSGYLRWRTDLVGAWAVLKRSLPLGLQVIGLAVIFAGDRLFISRMVGKGAVGLYSVGYVFGFLVFMITEASHRVWTPWVLKRLAAISEQLKTRIVRTTYAYGIFIGLVGVALFLVSPLLLKIMVPANYGGAQAFVLWLTMAYAVHGMDKMVHPYLLHTNSLRFMGLSSSVTAILNLAANYILIRANGAVGAAQATFLAFTFKFAVSWWYTNRAYPMPWFSFLGKSDACS